jgi:hypothetical protein
MNPPVVLVTREAGGMEWEKGAMSFTKNKAP